MQIKKVYTNNAIQNIFLLRTLSEKDIDPSSNCCTNLRLDQDIVKFFKIYLRLKNVWKNVQSELEKWKKKVLTLAQMKKGRFVCNLSQICPIASNKSWSVPDNWSLWMSGKILDQTKKQVLIAAQTFHHSRHILSGFIHSSNEDFKAVFQHLSTQERTDRFSQHSLNVLWLA